MSKLKFCTKGFWPLARKLDTSIGPRGFSLICQSRETQNTETKERVRDYDHCSNISMYTGLCNKDSNAPTMWLRIIFLIAFC